jgi:xylulokinase
LLGAVAAGAFADVHEAVEACVRTSERFEPVEGWVRAYEAGYPRYRALYPSLEHLEER